jgi:succinoglycan biosynthesis protein ExoA
VLILFVLIVLSLFVGFARYLLAAQLFVYFFALVLAGTRLAIKKNTGSLLLGLPLAISTMHMAWGAGFLWSGISSPFTKHG